MVMDVPTIEGIEIHDRISDELPGGVIGDVAAAADLEDLDARRAHLFLGALEVPTIRAPAEGHDRWMLEQEQTIAAATRQSIRHRLLLELECLCVGLESEPIDREAMLGGAIVCPLGVRPRLPSDSAQSSNSPFSRISRMR